MESNLSIPFDGATEYSEAYRSYVFRFWYNNGKPGPVWIYKNIPMASDYVTGKALSSTILQRWIHQDFIEYATMLDVEVGKALDTSIIKERVEMLTRHSVIALALEKMAMEYLTSEDAVLDTRTALQMLVKGIEIERESRGLPIDQLLEFKNQTDKELVDTLRSIISDGKILEIEPYEPDADET